jgi:hypothetical protein
MHWTGVDVAHNAHGAHRSALRRPGARALGFRRLRLARRFRARALPPLETRMARSKLASLTRGETRFAPRERGPVQFSEADALKEEFDYIERIDRLTAIAEDRRNGCLNEIERRRLVLGQTLRRPADRLGRSRWRGAADPATSRPGSCKHRGRSGQPGKRQRGVAIAFTPLTRNESRQLRQHRQHRRRLGRRRARSGRTTKSG